MQRATCYRTCHLLLIVAGFFVRNALAQNIGSEASATPSASPSPTPIVFSERTLADLKQLQQAALSSDYAFREVAHLSNNIGPRLTGSTQASKAVEYVAAEMKAIGCEVQLEEVIVPHWVRGEESGALVQYPGQAEGTTQKIVLTALGASVAAPVEGITADLICLRDFDELKTLTREKLSGKIVLFNHAFDKQMAAQSHGGEAYGQAVVYRSDGPSAAAKLGAVACLIRSVGGADYRLPHAGQTKYEDGAPKIPAAAVTAEDADLIAALTREGAVKMKLILTPQTLPDTESANVIADLKGSEHPEQIIIISGHLDSWDLGTGAIDDGAGVAVSMEAVHLIKQLNLRPKRTIRFIAWVDEESGASGARAYVKTHAAELANHFAAIETDLGAGHPMGIFSDGAPSILESLKPVSNLLQSSGAGVQRQTEEAGSDIGVLGLYGV